MAAQSQETATRDAATAMSEAAREILYALRPHQYNDVAFPLDDDSTRHDWAYFPREFHGLALGQLDRRQQKLVHRLLSTTLSLHAYTQVTTVIALENVLDAIEGYAGPFVRDPNLYYLSVFGDPSAPTWAWQFEGHHVCLNLTIAEGEVVSSTPLFLGSNPAEVVYGDRHVLRVLGAEQDAGLELINSLDDEQRQVAVLADIAPPDFVLMNLPRVPARAPPGEAGGPTPTVRAFERYSEEHREQITFDRNEPAGISWAELRESQRERLQALVDVYFDRLPRDLAQLHRSRLNAAGPARLHFAWAGDRSPGCPHYYRLQGPGLVVEYDNTQNDANHIHAVWRDPENDFGDDVLRQHLQASHASSGC